MEKRSCFSYCKRPVSLDAFDAADETRSPQAGIFWLGADLRSCNQRVARHPHGYLEPLGIVGKLLPEKILAYDSRDTQDELVEILVDIMPQRFRRPRCAIWAPSVSDVQSFTDPNAGTENST